MAPLGSRHEAAQAPSPGLYKYGEITAQARISLPETLQPIEGNIGNS